MRTGDPNVAATATSEAIGGREEGMGAIGIILPSSGPISSRRTDLRKIRRRVRLRMTGSVKGDTVKRGSRRSAPSEGAEKQESAPPGERQARKLPLQPAKRRPAAIGVAVALAVVGGLLAWNAAQSSGSSPYLVTNQTIERGQTIDQSALGTIEVVGDPSGLIPAENASELIGQVSTMDLAPGTAVTKENTAPSLGVPKGQSVVGLALEAGKLPSRALHAGDTVLIVQTPTAGAAPQQNDVQIATVVGTVEATRVDEVSGRSVVDVRVGAADTPKVAAWAASETVSIALQQSGSPR